MDIPRDRYEALFREIASDDSPVGIDAARTHVMILHLLEELGRRLDRIEARLEASGASGIEPSGGDAGGAPSS